jgi:hypothetical protein
MSRWMGENPLPAESTTDYSPLVLILVYSRQLNVESAMSPLVRLVIVGESADELNSSI